MLKLNKEEHEKREFLGRYSLFSKLSIIYYSILLTDPCENQANLLYKNYIIFYIEKQELVYFQSN